jgi:anthranilate phosphoribosyltransferase
MTDQSTTTATATAGPVPAPTLADLGGWSSILGKIVDRVELNANETRAALGDVLAGHATAAQLAAFLVGIRVRGETVDELTGFHRALMAEATLVDLEPDLRDRAVDIVGTGGDRTHSVNVSTMAALVVAGAGVPVVKHGSRAASSQCGAADVLEALGVNIELGPADIVRSLRTAGMAFCFAQRFHPALRHAGPVRRELGVPTLFNQLGPMANPARVRRYLLGVADWAVADKMLSVMANTGVLRAMVVQGHGGLDELSIEGPSRVLELRDGVVRSEVVEPAALGITIAPLSTIRGGEPARNAEIVHETLGGATGPIRDIVALNSAAALMVAGVVDSLTVGLELAFAVLDDGRASVVLSKLVAASQADANEQ